MTTAIRPTSWWGLFITTASVYILLRSFMPLTGDWLVKIVPILLLIQWAADKLQGSTKRFMLTGLFLSLAGDVLLSLNGLFIQGLGAFLLAQLSYTVLFLKQAKWQPIRLIWCALIVLYTGACIGFILPHTGDLKVVVTAYLCAITLMALSAGFRGDKDFLICASGAFVFMVSDTLIAINKFVTPFHGSGAAIMTTYYIAQFLITYGVIRHSQNQA